MKFNQYKTSFQRYKNNKGYLRIDSLGNVGSKYTLHEYYNALDSEYGERTIYRFERFWENDGRPYYNVYPSLIPMLTKIDIDEVPMRMLSRPSGLQNFVIRFPEDAPLHGIVKTLGLVMCKNPETDIENLVLIFEYGNSDGNISIPLKGVDKNVGELWGDLYYRQCSELPDELPYVCIEDAFRLVVTLCLLGDSPELIQPEVLNADEHKLTGQHNIEALVAKARRRGKFGFTIGKDIEVMPHYRRPHLALVWYGKGKKKSKIIPRKGSIVHRAAVEKIPTGYAADESA